MTLMRKWVSFDQKCFPVFVEFKAQYALRVDVDPTPNRKSGKSGVERMLEFGRELFQLSQRLEKEHGANEINQKMLEVISNSIIAHVQSVDYICSIFQDAFSLLAYSNPWSSPLGWQLCPSRRETICAALNSAILGNAAFNCTWLQLCTFKKIIINVYWSIVCNYIFLLQMRNQKRSMIKLLICLTQNFSFRFRINELFMAAADGGKHSARF